MIGVDWGTTSFRAFRIDRMEDVLVLERTFVPRRGQTLEDFIKAAMPKPDQQFAGRRGLMMGGN